MIKVRDYDNEERIYPQMKRKLVSVMRTPYVVNDPTINRTHQGDVRAVAVGNDGIASVDGTQLILHLHTTDERDNHGSEWDEGVVCDADRQTTVSLPENCHPQLLAFSAKGHDIALVDHSGHLLVRPLHGRGDWQSVSLGKHGDSVGLFSVTTNKTHSDWIVVRHDRVTMVTNGAASDLCQHAAIVGATYSQDKHELSFVDREAKLVTYSLSGETPSCTREIQLAENVAWSKAFFSPDGKHLAAINGSEKSGAVYDCDSGDNVCSFQAPRPTARREDTDLTGAAFSSDGTQLWVANESGEIGLYHVQTGRKSGACETEAVLYEGEQPRPAAMMVVTGSF